VTPVAPEVARYGDTVVVEGALLGRACRQFEEALGQVRESLTETPTVDLSHVRAVATEAMGSLFALWLELARQGRALRLVAPDYVWQMFGEAAVEQMRDRPRSGRAGRAVQPRAGR